MRKVVALVAVAGSLVLASTASSAYYTNRAGAEHYLRLLLHEQYGYKNTGVYCQPQKGRNERYAEEGKHLYHRWLCGFVSGTHDRSCKGAITIYGSDSSAGFMYYRHASRGESC